MTIRCYKNYQKPIALGFDLDDTLYDNRPVLLNAERKLRAYLTLHFPKTQSYLPADWLAFRHQAIDYLPALNNDTSALRLAVLQLALRQHYSESEAIEGATNAFNEFIHWRNNVVITTETHQLLSALAQHFRLFVISNGNANVERLGISQYFEFALQPSIDVAMKPAPDLFTIAQQRLRLQPDTISYVGDHPISDVQGACVAGWQSIWLNLDDKPLDHYKKSLTLPSIELTALTDITALI